MVYKGKMALTELGVGQALVSVLDEEGIPTMVKRCKILPPMSCMGSVSEEDRKSEYMANNLYLTYKDAKDSDSAYEYLERLNSQREFAKEEAAKAAAEEKEAALTATQQAKLEMQQAKAAAKEEAARKKKVKRAVGSVASSAAGTVGREIGQNLGKGIGGSFGKKVGGNVMAQLGRSLMGTLFK